jgi:hypothetical protein
LDTVGAASGADSAAAEHPHLAVAGKAASARDRPFREKRADLVAARVRRPPTARTGPTNRFVAPARRCRRSLSPTKEELSRERRGTDEPRRRRLFTGDAARFSAQMPNSFRRSWEFWLAIDSD